MNLTSIYLPEVCISRISAFLFLLFDYNVCLSLLSRCLLFPTDLPKTHYLKGNLCLFVSQFFLSFLHSISKESHPYYQGATIYSCKGFLKVHHPSCLFVYTSLENQKIHRITITYTIDVLKSM